MLRATTLVHKGAMPVAVHSIRSFAVHFGKTHELAIHTDPSVDEGDCELLLSAAEGIRTEIIPAGVRKTLVNEKVNGFKNIRSLLERGAYFNKLEIAITEETPYFYFDSDTFWLKHVDDLRPPGAPNAFSTETWSAYSGISKPWLWVSSKTPQRVNSGFYYINERFPFGKLEDFLEKGMYHPGASFAGDQEIFAYLYNNMEYYHPEDMKRGRFGVDYDLSELTCAAMHFPGGMWQFYLSQMAQMCETTGRQTMQIRFLKPVAISLAEILHMRIRIKIGDSKFLNKPLNLVRRLLRKG